MFWTKGTVTQALTVRRNSGESVILGPVTSGTGSFVFLSLLRRPLPS